MNTVNIKEQKTLLRNKYREKRKQLSDGEKKARDEAICKKFISLNSYRYCDTILLYSPLKYEIDTTLIAEDALSKGKKVCYPRCIEDNKMVYHYISSKADFILGKYNIIEPLSHLPVYSGENCHPICVLPAIIYDKRGYRLGYGKGYYDRFLSNFKGIKAGLIYSDFVVENIPNGKFDLRSDIIVTEKGVISFAKN